MYVCMYSPYKPRQTILFFCWLKSFPTVLCEYLFGYKVMVSNMLLKHGREVFSTNSDQSKVQDCITECDLKFFNDSFNNTTETNFAILYWFLSALYDTFMAASIVFRNPGHVRS